MRAPYLVALACSLCLNPAAADTLTVDTTSDSIALSACTATAEDCSLRGAMAAAAVTPGADTIEFAIPPSDPGCDASTGICRIVVASDFAGFSQPLLIDGYTQPGSQPNSIAAPGANNAQLRIEITASPGFVSNALFAPNNTLLDLRGLAIFMPSNGIVRGTSRFVIQGNWFGVTALGEVPDYSGNGNLFDLGSFNQSITIGGPAPADRNVLAGSGRDQNGLPGGGSNTLRVNSSAVTRGLILVQGNLIGLGPNGVHPLPFRNPLQINPGDDTNQTPDVRILDNRFTRAERDFSAGVGNALRFSISRTMDDFALVQGNVFGLGVDGSRIGVERDHIVVALGNSTRVPRLLVGGLGEGEGNVFAAATPAPGGTEFAPSLGTVVTLPSGASANTVVEIVGNTMLDNEGIGLDFPHGTPGGGVALGRTLNDPGDADTGANNLQNHPAISAFSVAAEQLSLTYRVDSDPAVSAYPLRVDFYRALGDEGEVLVGSDSYEAGEAQTDKSIVLPIPAGAALDNDDVLVAVATDAEGRSSEFSFDTLTLAITDTPDPQPAGESVIVEAVTTATSGPFKPNGIVRVSMSTQPPTVCDIALQPAATALTSLGSCELIPMQSGNFTITAAYLTQRGAFASDTGGNVSVTAPHQVGAAGSESVSFSRCRAVALEGRNLEVVIERPQGGATVAQVELVHIEGSALAGLDYTPPVNPIVAWASGDTAPKRISIPIASDGQSEGTESFRLRLAHPQGTAVLPIQQMDVQILDGDDQGFRDGFEGECAI